MEYLLDAFIYGKGGTDAKYGNSHHECPEIDFFTVTKRVLFIRRSGSTFMTDQQHDLIYAVCRAVEAFGEHGRTARKNGDNEFHYGNGGVAEKCRIDNLFIAVFLHFSISKSNAFT